MNTWRVYRWRPDWNEWRLIYHSCNDWAAEDIYLALLSAMKSAPRGHRKPRGGAAMMIAPDNTIHSRINCTPVNMNGWPEGVEYV